MSQSLKDIFKENFVRVVFNTSNRLIIELTNPEVCDLVLQAITVLFNMKWFDYSDNKEKGLHIPDWIGNTTCYGGCQRWSSYKRKKMNQFKLCEYHYNELLKLIIL